jgi:hypothetical protein
MGFGDSIAIPLAYGCAFFAPFQGRPTGGGKIVIKCSKIATGHRQAAKRSIKSPGATALASPAGSIQSPQGDANEHYILHHECHLSR